MAWLLEQAKPGRRMLLLIAVVLVVATVVAVGQTMAIRRNIQDDSFGTAEELILK